MEESKRRVRVGIDKSEGEDRTAVVILDKDLKIQQLAVDPKDELWAEIERMWIEAVALIFGISK